MKEEFEHKVDITKPRRLYDNKVTGFSACPECGLPLIEYACSVAIIAKSDTDEAEFLCNLALSHFCNACPVVVYDSDILRQAISLGMYGVRNLSYNIEGIINLKAVPKEKMHLEFGTEENPIPLIPFLPDLNKRTIVAGKKISRNASCTCGSEKKYKRCCSK